MLTEILPNTDLNDIAETGIYKVSNIHISEPESKPLTKNDLLNILENLLDSYPPDSKNPEKDEFLKIYLQLENSKDEDVHVYSYLNKIADICRRCK